MSSNSKRVHHCGVCRETGHQADSNKFHPKPIQTHRVTVPVVPVVPVLTDEQRMINANTCSICFQPGHTADSKSFHPDRKRDVIEHVEITEVSLDDIPAYKEPGLVLVPKLKHIGVYSTMATILERVTSGELQEDTAKDILIALTKCL